MNNFQLWKSQEISEFAGIPYRPISCDTIRLVKLIQIHVEVDGLANLCRLVRSGWKVPHSQMVRTGFPKSAHSTVRRFDDVPVTSSIHSTHITSHNCLHMYFNFLIFTKFHIRICLQWT